MIDLSGQIGIKYLHIDTEERIIPNLTIDAIDQRILSELQQDGRITNHDLAGRVGLSPSPCLRRVRQLEEAGIIRNYVGLVDPAAVGLQVSAFIRVRLDGQDDRHLAAFEQMIAGFPEVMECYLMTGECDYQLRVLVASLAEFEEFLRQKLTRISGVSQVTSSFALRPIVYRTAIPVGPRG
ncbi:Lrp/AsnC family transcriptional regulator [Sphingomonas sp. Root710]|uniref:Lrp/AsnC family transcriptional regulator n=1 Tax=Sphingomonas sp. Root710 TaxID=1736594 RepID=UPI0009EB52D9|nr:Lrp/AsnC family transcriptional regulator [Sphingomonas sp. Root710]